MNYPPWRQSLSRSLHVCRSKPESKFFQVANIDQNSMPQNRTMVFRGFDDNTLDIYAITDIRSEKYHQWKRHPYAQITWYFTKTREQYRISCAVNMRDLNGEVQTDTLDNSDSLTIVRNLHKQRERVWEGLSQGAKEQFNWAHPKYEIGDNLSSTLDTNMVSKKLKEKSSPPNEEIKPYLETPDKHFVLVSFIPKEVDYLDLKPHPQIRQVSRIELSNKPTDENVSSWKTVSVNP